MSEDAARRQADGSDAGAKALRAQAADYHVAEQRRRDERESAKAQVFVDAFVAEAKKRQLPTEPLTARPWSGGGRYQTDVTGWYLRRDRAIGVDVDGNYYVLVVAPERFGRWRTIHVEPTPPPLQTGKGGRDGDSVALDALLALRLEWAD